MTASVVAGEIPGLAIVNAEAEKIFQRLSGAMCSESVGPLGPYAEMLTLKVLSFYGYPIHEETRARLHDLAGQSANGLTTKGI